jgi:hypothetical protein
LRIKIAILILILTGLISIYQKPEIANLKVSPANEVLVILDRARCLNGSLPEDIRLFGFLPPVDLIVHSKEGAFKAANDMRRLFLMRTVLTPVLISQTPQSPWVIAYFPDVETGKKYLKGQPYQVVKSCENGVFLLKK